MITIFNSNVRINGMKGCCQHWINMCYRCDCTSNKPLPEKCPNAVLFLVRSYFYAKYLSVFIPNTEKYGPELTQYLDTFHAVQTISIIFSSIADPSKSEYVIPKLIINKIKMFYKDLL